MLEILKKDTFKLRRIPHMSVEAAVSKSSDADYYLCPARDASSHSFYFFLWCKSVYRNTVSKLYLKCSPLDFNIFRITFAQSIVRAVSHQG